MIQPWVGGSDEKGAFADIPRSAMNQGRRTMGVRVFA
jgi:hypothetical protein